jgi:hypothetical protein
MRKSLFVATGLFALVIAPQQSFAEVIDLKGTYGRFEIKSACDNAGGTYSDYGTNGYGCVNKNCNQTGGDCEVGCKNDGSCYGSCPACRRTGGPDPRGVAGIEATLANAGSPSTRPPPRFSISRSPGRGIRIEIECTEREPARACVNAAISGVLSPNGSGATVIYATSSIKCGNTIYEVSTGTDGGNCATSGPQNEPRNSVGCTDSGGNQASASCGEGCGASTGAGSCKIK